MTLNQRRLTLKGADREIILSGEVSPFSSGYKFLFSVQQGEFFYGLGDLNRNTIERKGVTARMWIQNVTRYIPIPFLMSSRGYGLFLNTTFRHTWDVASSDLAKVQILIPEGPVDLFLFAGKDFKSLLARYTAVTGRRCLRNGLLVSGLSVGPRPTILR
ncbi:MAG TPA: hypothetical protein PKX93_00125 [bacterium]|nr:hypothetical protein [bacterium]HOL65847.1 hypothetical protein [bacterium]HPP11103.1 hypothetical protein [bacterium]